MNRPRLDLKIVLPNTGQGNEPVTHRRNKQRTDYAPKPKELGRWIKLEDGRSVYRIPRPQGPDCRSHLPAPQISGDYEAYECPVTGKMVDGRAEHRENLERTGCRLLEPGEKAECKKRGEEKLERSLNEIDAVVDQTYADLSA